MGMQVLMSSKKTVPYGLTPGSVITGKWNGSSYCIIRLIGQGANGSVFLADSAGTQVALKVCSHAADLALEYKVLVTLAKERASSPGPRPIELDDWVSRSGTLFFYAMEYIQGEQMESFITRKGQVWIGAFLLQLLGDLSDLHASGHSFGDLKAENLLISKDRCRIRLVDFGGVSQFGKAIREYTEWYDRAFWNAGNRRADIAYDLFATAQLLIKLSCPSLSVSTFANLDARRRGEALFRQLSREAVLQPWRSVINKAWTGGYSSADQMRSDIARIQQEWLNKQRKSPKLSPTQQQLAMSVKKPRRKWDWTDWSILAASFLAAAVLVKLFGT
ncbi:MAG: serine/threonine protein kinase [Bacilli bacterium]|nr:serine/threonine protein kinase [Bacilli bacterium]